MHIHFIKIILYFILFSTNLSRSLFHSVSVLKGLATSTPTEYYMGCFCSSSPILRQFHYRYIIFHCRHAAQVRRSALLHSVTIMFLSLLLPQFTPHLLNQALLQGELPKEIHILVHSAIDRNMTQSFLSRSRIDSSLLTPNTILKFSTDKFFIYYL